MARKIFIEQCLDEVFHLKQCSYADFKTTSLFRKLQQNLTIFISVSGYIKDREFIGIFVFFGNLYFFQYSTMREKAIG